MNILIKNIKNYHYYSIFLFEQTKICDILSEQLELLDMTMQIIQIYPKKSKPKQNIIQLFILTCFDSYYHK